MMRTLCWLIAGVVTLTACANDSPSAPSPMLGQDPPAAAPVAPFSTLVHIDPRVHDTLNPVSVQLEAGTYVVVPVGAAQGGTHDAWTPWATTTCVQPDGCAQTSPTTVTGWKNAYDVLSPDIATVRVGGQLLDPVPAEPTAGQAHRDYFLVNATTARYHVNDGTVYPTPQAALAAARSSSFSLSRSGPVGFSIRDIRPLADNRGGISLRVTRE